MKTSIKAARMRWRIFSRILRSAIPRVRERVWDICRLPPSLQTRGGNREIQMLAEEARRDFPKGRKATLTKGVLPIMTSVSTVCALCGTMAEAQTATPSQMPNLPDIQVQIDRNGIDRASGNLTNLNYEAVQIGNQHGGMAANYGSSGSLNLISYLELEKVKLYDGGFIAARVVAGGEVHAFTLGSIAAHHQANFPGNTDWSYAPLQTDTFADVNGDGAILTCSGPRDRIYVGGACSLYLANSGDRINFRMPSVPYDHDLLSLIPGIVMDDSVVYAWPTKLYKPDGEILTYNYLNYSEYSFETASSGSTTWNSVDSSLGFRIYVSNVLPTNYPNPGAYSSPGAPYTQSGALHAINTSKEYADPLTTSRSFGSGAQTSMRIPAAAPPGSDDLTNNGVKILNQGFVNSNLAITKPGGGTLTYAGVAHLAPFLGFINGRAADPSNAFPFKSFSVTKNGTTNYAVSFDETFLPETYTETISNPDGSTETYVVRYGNIQSYTDGLGRLTTFEYLNQEGYYAGIPGYARVSKIRKITRPDGISTTYVYTRGALTGVIETASSGGQSLTTTLGLMTSCDTTNYRVCNKPQYLIDPNGNRTDYTYDPAHGGLLTETLPADANGVRPQKRYAYSQLTPRVKNASGALVANPPVWRLTKVSECASATSANPASCVGTSAERITTFAYANDNLWLTSETTSLGDGAQGPTISYAYDYAGDVTSINGPRTDVDDTSYFTYDALRRNVFEVGADRDGAGPLPRQIVHHVYDADGNEVRTEFGTGAATNGSDFALQRFRRMIYDPVSGLLTKTEEVAP